VLLNLMASPGAGKTPIERTVEKLSAIEQAPAGRNRAWL
jgi:hypothetical protein